MVSVTAVDLLLFALELILMLWYCCDKTHCIFGKTRTKNDRIYACFTHFDRRLHTEINKNQHTQLYTFVKRLLHNTWKDDLTSCGRDATKLKHKAIKIRKIYLIQNETLERRYEACYTSSATDHPLPSQLLDDPVKTQDAAFMRQTLTGLKSRCLQNASVMAIADTAGETTPSKNAAITATQSNVAVTAENADDTVVHMPSDDEPLHPRFAPGILRDGEVYLFHGTLYRNARKIIRHGFDVKKCQRTAYGTGVYLAESSQKADQYTDPVDDRRNSRLTIIVFRTFLGKVKMEGQTSTGFDTYVAGLKNRFREFIKPNSDQCYPEFVVEYDRKSH